MRARISCRVALVLSVVLMLNGGCGDDTTIDAGADVASSDSATSDGVLDGAGTRDANPIDSAGSDSGGADTGGPDGGPGERAIGPRPVPETPVGAGTLFAAPDGGGDACTQANPCDVWEAASQLAGGDVLFLRGGIYAIDRNLTWTGRGRSPSPAVVESYPGETAILEGSRDAGDEYYVRLTGDGMVLRRFDVRHMPRAGISVRSSDHLLEGIRAYDNLLSGIHVHNSYEEPASNNNVIRDCEAFGNSGAGLTTRTFADGGNSDGISMSSGVGNRVENCLVYGNSDDGIDTWRTTDSYVGYSIIHTSGIASGNGQGVKAGGSSPSARSYVEHCISYRNRGAGFDFNSGDEVVFLNNTSWENGRGYYGGDNTRVEANIAGEEDAFGGPASPNNNSWQRDGIVEFVSTEPTSPDFLRPVSGGGFDDIGAHAGLGE